jgi:hypothetical protein
LTARASGKDASSVKYEIRSIGLWSFVKLSFFLNLALGFIVGIIYAILLGVVLSISSRMAILEQTNEDLSQMSFGVMMVFIPIVMAFFMAVFNTIIGAIGVGLYNFFTRLLGGMEMELQEMAGNRTVPVGDSPMYASASATPPPPPPYGSPPAAPGQPSIEPRRLEPPASKYE